MCIPSTLFLLATYVLQGHARHVQIVSEITILLYYIVLFIALNIIQYSTLAIPYDIAIGIQLCTRCMINTHLFVNRYYIYDILVRCTVETDVGLNQFTVA